MIDIKMLKTIEGCEDGFSVKTYLAKKEYEVSESLFNSFKNMGVCELITVKQESVNITVTPVVETIVDTPVIERKVMQPKENKITRKRKAKK